MAQAEAQAAQAVRLKQLITIRGSIKGQLTKFKNYFESQAEKDIMQLQVRLEKAEPLYESFTNVQDEIEDLDAKEVEGNERLEFENKYFDIIAKVRKYIQAKSQAVQVENVGVIQGSHNNQSSKVKLPTVALPTFNGEYNKWLLYKDAFQSLIHSNTSLVEIQKFQYLRGSLQGEPLQVIQSLETSSENYKIAWDLLVNRYENKRLIINTHLKGLFEMAVIQRNSHTALSKFIDDIRTHLRSLEALKLPVKEWDAILVYMLTEKLDFSVRKEWEDHISKEGKVMPTTEELLEFLTHRSLTLMMINKSNVNAIGQGVRKPERRQAYFTSTGEHICEYCKGTHWVARCEKFKQLSLEQRREQVPKLNLCFNCLGGGHRSKECKRPACKICNKHHHILLHNSEQPGAKVEATQKTEEMEKAVVVTHAAHREKEVILLSTARISVKAANGQYLECTALLDSGSQSSFVTKELCERLGLTLETTKIPVQGINRLLTQIKQRTTVNIKSKWNRFEAKIDCLVLPKITEGLPQREIDIAEWNIPLHIQLADEKFYLSKSIDMLLGGEIFWDLLREGQIKLAKNLPVLQNTALGWIIAGRIWENTRIERSDKKFVGVATLQEQVEKFWATEELNNTKLLSSEEEQCERYFEETVKRDCAGRFIVKLPKKSINKLGDSSKMALRRLQYLERRFEREQELERDYRKFIQEYEDLGHMEIVNSEKESIEPTVYLPHHPVIKQESITTKVRVVFDASMKTTTGISLNDQLMVGPKLQDDLFNILLRFRCHEFVITADIGMMYRQIWVDKEDQSLQRIYWRNKDAEEVSTYQLKTVTYGTACAPYLATRCLKQLAIEDGDNYPKAKQVLMSDFYMDDVLSGAHTIEEARELQGQLIELLNKGGCQLRKWRANHEEILSDLDQKIEAMMVLDKQPVKTLGLLWDSKLDALIYKVKLEDNKKITKRTILGKIAKLFDPLGLLGPVIVVAKLIMQTLWTIKADWDEELIGDLREAWKKYYEELIHLNEVKIPRNVNPRNKVREVMIHGFSDASERAFGACVYVEYEDEINCVNTYLLTSKSKVAPLKKLSLPRLELNAALLLARLIDVVRKALGNRIKETYYWTDSLIVLTWIKTPPHRLKTFVGNRVAEIQNLTDQRNWGHVGTKDNPADLLSRGITAKNLGNCELWWKGPHWLENQNNWPSQNERKEFQEDELELKPQVVYANLNVLPLERYSSFNKLVRIIAYCWRFFDNLRRNTRRGSLLVEELKRATVSIIREVQGESFSTEVEALKSEHNLPKNSKLLNLNPFLDNDHLLRVGGRLKHANIDKDNKHPVILPKGHHIAKLIMELEHENVLHGGADQMLASIRLKYWPLAGRRLAKQIIKNCTKCFRVQPRNLQPLMGNLPEDRVTPSIRPFVRCGVDYAGPIQIKEGKRRGRPNLYKAYIAVFVCLVTKAVHIELVTDLSTEAFMACFRRMIARRGLCNIIWSDNATNFRGADAALKKVYEFLKTNEHALISELAKKQITWKFIPPRSPHMGGIWESTVKGVKRHLYKVMQNVILTYEECYTLLVEIEACLNSRPLSPLTDDPNDMTPLTPAHFLIGDSLKAPVEVDLISTSTNQLSRWQHLQKLRQDFWKRWQKEYLHQLQTRSKWRSSEKNIQVGDLVLLKEDNVPSLKWVLGRVAELHPGDDDVVRVVSVKTKNGVVKRAAHKLCLLPKSENSD